jgi:[acyl-carrier-protein] S-malonyltransferase
LHRNEKDLYENSPLAAELFEKANEILGFRESQTSFEGTAEELKETKLRNQLFFYIRYILAKLRR